MSDARGLVEHLFRHQAGRLVARLTRVFGPAHLELAEDVVQEALMAALDTWPYRGVPDDPAAWLARVAKNRAFDALRRSATLADREAELRAWTPDAEATGDTVAGELPSDDLLMVFTCCHPDIGAESRVALTLKTLGGFGVREIARAFLSSETTIAQRLVRAKRRLRASGAGFELPRPAELGERLGSVLEVLYLLFNEGYASTAGEALLREDVMDEALRLTDLLLAHAPTAVPEAHALAALMLFQSARNPARVDGSGGLLLLAEQDRGRWDAARIQAGFRRLAAARGGDALTRYHLEAGIAACHAQAPTFEATDWAQILAFYDLLVARHSTPITRLNRAVAVTFVRGPLCGLAELDALGEPPALARYFLLPATRGELLLRAGDRAGAAVAFADALARGCSAPERRFLERRLAGC